MKMSHVLKIKKQILRKRIYNILFLASGVLSILFAIITFYGQNAGNFVMTIDYDAHKRGIVLSKDESFTNPASQLMTRAIDTAIDMNYSWLKLDQVVLANGNYIDPDMDYIAYTFHIKNNGSETVDIGYHIRITDVYKNMDAAIRVLVIEEGVETIYKKPNYPITGVPVSDSTNNVKTVHFLTDSIVTRKRIEKFQPGETRKFSIVIWIEGEDPDTIDEILGGMVKLQMIFAIDNGS